MNVLFRADSSSSIGIGHVMRDLVLARQYENSNIIFATQNLNGNINYKIEESNYKIEILKSNDIDELKLLLEKLKVDLLVIDHYGIDEVQEKELKNNNPNMKILCFDDMYKKHYCDILLNHNINADVNKYKALVPKDCEVRCGSEYTLIREEFLSEKVKKYIFLAIGGTDTYNMNIEILEILKQVCKIHIYIVTTSSNENLDKLRHYIEGKSWISLNIDSSNIAKIMRKSDFAIVSASVIVHEVIYMDLPYIAIKIEDNQNEIFEYLKQKNECCIEKEYLQESLEKCVRSFL